MGSRDDARGTARSSKVLVARGLRIELGFRPVLDGVDLVVKRGSVVALLGANGAGKSTLLRCLAGLDRFDSGDLEVLGGLPVGGREFWRRVALAAEEPDWYPGLTAREHLELVRLTHEPIEVAWPTPEAMLQALALAEVADASPPILSSGLRQRLALAAALTRPSELLLLDEPEHGLDDEARRLLATALSAYAADGGSVVMATHDLDLVANCAARALRLTGGRLVPAVVDPTGRRS